MDVQQKPHPHSIEVILGLTETNKRTTRSFRPYSRSNDGKDSLQSSEYNERFYTRLVPRLGIVPRPLGTENTELTGKSDNTQQRLSFPVFDDSVNIKGNEEAERYLYTKSVTTAENVSTDDQNMKVYRRTMEQGNKKLVYFGLSNFIFIFNHGFFVCSHLIYNIYDLFHWTARIVFIHSRVRHGVVSKRFYRSQNGNDINYKNSHGMKF